MPAAMAGLTMFGLGLGLGLRGKLATAGAFGLCRCACPVAFEPAAQEAVDQRCGLLRASGKKLAYVARTTISTFVALPLTLLAFGLALF